MADLNLLVNKLSKRVQPNDDFYKFSDLELQEEILDALVHLDPDLTIETLTKQDELMLLYKARSSCYYFLAGKHAENMRFRIENDEYHGNQPHTAYLTMAKQYEALYDELAGGGRIHVNTVTRTQTGTGRKAPYYEGDTP